MSGRYPVSITASNKERRIFRGRGGPKDGNLPPRRVKKIQDGEKSPKYSTPAKNVIPNINVDDDDDEDDSTSQNVIGNTSSSSNDNDDEKKNNNDNSTNEDIPFMVDDKRIQEIKHLRRRIHNIEESIKLSNAALCNPNIWEANCLNAVHNCVGEWRSIVSYYFDANNDDDEVSKEISVNIFGLVQMSMQSGPLTGAKPGYFKRCGDDVAAIAHRFLLKTVSGDSITELKFTEKQSQAIAKWVSNAEKAIAKGDPPSKSAQKLQSGNNMKISSKTKKKQQKGKKR